MLKFVTLLDTCILGSVPKIQTNGISSELSRTQKPEDFGGTLLTRLSYFVYIWHNQFILNEN